MTIKSFLHKLSSYDGDFYLKKALANVQSPQSPQIFIIHKAVEEINKQLTFFSSAISEAKSQLSQKASQWFSGGDSKRALEILSKEIDKYNAVIAEWNKGKPEGLTKKYLLSPEVYKLLQAIGAVGQLKDQTVQESEPGKILSKLQSVATTTYQNILKILEQTQEEGQETTPPGGLQELPSAASLSPSASASGAPAIGTQGALGGAQQLSTSQVVAPVNFKLTEAEEYFKKQLDALDAKTGSKAAVQKLLDGRVRYIDSMAVSKKDSYGQRDSAGKLKDLLTQDERPKYKQRAQQIAAPYFAKFSR